MRGTSGALIFLLLVVFGQSYAHAAQARATLRDHAAAALPLHSEAVQAADAGAEEPAADVARAQLQLDMGLPPQRDAAPAARHDDTGATADGPAPVEQLEVGASGPDGASDDPWSSFSEDDYKAEQAAFELVGSSPWGMLHMDDKATLATLRSSLSEAAAARLEPQLWRLQWDYKITADISLNRRDWPIAVTISTRDSAAAQAAKEAVRNAAYGRVARKEAPAQPNDQLRLAVSPREQWLLERFDNGRLLADLQVLHNVSITVHRSILVVEGPRNAMDMAAAEIRQTIAVGRADEEMPRAPISSYPYAEENFGMTWRTMDVAPEVAKVLATSIGAEALRNAQGHLARTGICLAFSRGGSLSSSQLRGSAAAAVDVGAREPATLTLFGGRHTNVDYTEHVFRRWLGLDMSLEPDILQPLADALQHFGLADVALPYGAAPATQGNLTAWRRCCSTIRSREVPTLAPDGGEAYFAQADAEYLENRRDYRQNWSLAERISEKVLFLICNRPAIGGAEYLNLAFLAEWVIIQLLAVLMVGRMAFRMFQAHDVAQGGAPLQPPTANSGNAGLGSVPSSGKDGAASPH
jgi:hypothetical protein